MKAGCIATPRPAEDLMAAFADPTIKGIISTIGGDDSIGCCHTWTFLMSFEPTQDLCGVFRHHDQPFGLLQSRVSHVLWPGNHGWFAENGGMFSYMVESVRKTLFSSEPIGVIAPNPDGWTVEMLDWADPANQTRRRQLNPSTGWRFLQGP